MEINVFNRMVLLQILKDMKISEVKVSTNYRPNHDCSNLDWDNIIYIYDNDGPYNYTPRFVDKEIYNKLDSFLKKEQIFPRQWCCGFPIEYNNKPYYLQYENDCISINKFIV